VEYICEEGYFIVGSSKRTCSLTEKSTAHWVPEAPECKVQGMPVGLV